MQSLTRPNGSVTTYQYDLLNRLTEISNTNSSAEVLNQHVFAYNNLDLRDSETITGSALPSMPSVDEGTKDYDYNTVNQLLATINPTQSFVYDADGNMTQGYSPLEGGQGGVVPFTATYDAEDRMTSLEYTDSSVVHRTEYRYSGDGFLAVIRKYENSALVDTVRIVRDGLLAVQERDGSNAVVCEYTWGLNLGGGIGGLLALSQGGSLYSYLYDGKGNVEAVIDTAQNVVAAYRYDPFGKLLVKTGSLTQPFGFSTKWYDPDTGLIHYEYRPYAPAIGRWLTRDPLGEAGGLNLYAFVGNNPVNWMDPWGLMTGELVLKPIIEFIKIKLPSLALGSVASGVVGGVGGVIGNMIFPGSLNEGSDVIPLPVVPATTQCSEETDVDRTNLIETIGLPDNPDKYRPPIIDCGFVCATCWYYLTRDVSLRNAAMATAACFECARCLSKVW